MSWFSVCFVIATALLLFVAVTRVVRRACELVEERERELDQELEEYIRKIFEDGDDEVPRL